MLELRPLTLDNSAGAVPKEGAQQSGSGSGTDGGGGAAAASAALLEEERESTRDQTAASVEDQLQVPYASTGFYKFG